MRSSSSPFVAEGSTGRPGQVWRGLHATRSAPALGMFASAAAHLLLVAMLDGAASSASVPDLEPALLIIEPAPAPPPVVPDVPEPPPPRPPPERAPPPPTSAPAPTRPAAKADDTYDEATPPAPAANTEAPPTAPEILVRASTGASDGFAQGSGAGVSARVRPAKRDALPASRPAAAAPHPDVVALSDLSTPPKPPALDAALRRLYPDEARRAGRGGVATVRARIGPQGSVVETRIESASEPAFGAACQTLLARSQWSRPLDRGGRAVSTWIRYTCRFAAER